MKKKKKFSPSRKYNKLINLKVIKSPVRTDNRSRATTHTLIKYVRYI